ncbi:M15 family metallopeptidase [Leucobacter tenebrionis]|uniref:M15 family metallopeptidase n=1 Tax=Leucobacter tenebrionis TaxID=2873270 RepID=UPI001CA6296E|nr:M15 family metallopeptidase [Leucobacter tenebrionis]QZY51561.1 M15 family metallopeptidase [Leucobacter tenebrionis]
MNEQSNTPSVLDPGAQPRPRRNRRRNWVWGLATLAAVLVVAVGVAGTIRWIDERGAREEYRAAVERWDASSEDAAHARLSKALDGLDGETAAAQALAEALPEPLVGTEAKTALAGAVASAREAAEQHGAAVESESPVRSGDRRSPDELRAAAQEIEAALKERADEERAAEASLAVVAEQRSAVVSAADAAVEALAASAAQQAEPLTEASPEAKQALEEASGAVVEAPLPDAASSATALTAALETVRAEHDAAAAEEAEKAQEEARKEARAGADSGDPASITVVVNKQRPLNPISWEPGDLRMPAGIPNTNGQPVRAEAATALESMYAEASAAGLPFTITSAYRSYSLQVSLFESYAARDGVAAAETYSARPGHSEHQTGLAVDLDDGSGCAFESCFGETATGQWLRENAHRFGFILRYDAGQEPVVGFIYEPWHFRYVGTQVAGDMHERGIKNLEEYFGLPAAPSY